MTIIDSITSAFRNVTNPVVSTMQDCELEPGDEVSDLYYGRTFVVTQFKPRGVATFRARQKGTDNPVLTCHIADFFNDRGVK